MKCAWYNLLMPYSTNRFQTSPESQNSAFQCALKIEWELKKSEDPREIKFRDDHSPSLMEITIVCGALELYGRKRERESGQRSRGDGGKNRRIQARKSSGRQWLAKDFVQWCHSNCYHRCLLSYFNL